jgi:group I intron endonuclease
MGIYKIVNLNNDKFYIGSSINIERRWSEHNYQLGCDNHHSIKLQNAWNKYGERCFEFKIVEIVKNRKDLFSIEQEWINRTGCWDNGYNVSMFAGEIPSYISSKRKIDKKARLTFFKKEIIKLKEECYNNINYNDLIDLDVDIREKEISAIVFNKQSVVYNVLPIYYDIISQYILPDVKNELKDKLEIIIDLRVYNNKWLPEFRTKCDFIDNTISTSMLSYNVIIKIMKKYNISLKEAIIKGVTEIEDIPFVKFFNIGSKN